ncbi:MAG: excinuclease ABC subunit UvrB [Candidatus Rhabdochlamydia sp.]
MFKLHTPFEPKGDQPQAICQLVAGIENNLKSQVLLGITGSGKTFTMANVIQTVQKPALILAHNKTLAAQLYQEFKAFFPENAVEYFVSYYDYYQPEAYIARTDTYIEKDMAINDQIDRMRLSATRSLIERKDVIIIASVSCIYGLGLPEYFNEMKLLVRVGEVRERDAILLQLVQMHHTRSDFEITRGTFRVRGDVLEVMPAYEENIAYRIEFFGNDIERISVIDPLTGRVKGRQAELAIYPGSHHAIPDDIRFTALETIQEELSSRAAFFQGNDKFIENQRILERTKYDLEMIRNVGFCKGIENYSRHFSGKQAGEPPACLLDYFPSDFMIFVDESHQTMPQIHAMYNGDQARKKALIDFGFRLPSALDNRPLKFEEFYKKIHQVIYVSATPGAWEVNETSGVVARQIIRPTGLLDPIIEIKPATYQVDDALEQIRQNREKGGKTLVTTLTKKLAEDLTGYLKEIGLKARYLHSDIETLERVQIINELRKGTIDVLVGINLLREGLDIPEVSLVTILDADKEGFLRSETALIQTCGRAARNVNGRVIMYADKMTKSIEGTLRVTQERRDIQQRYNEKHGITPQSTQRMDAQDLARTFGEVIDELTSEEKPQRGMITPEEIQAKIQFYTQEMKTAAKELRFEDAAQLRDLRHQYEQLQLLE